MITLSIPGLLLFLSVATLAGYGTGLWVAHCAHKMGANV